MLVKNIMTTGQQWLSAVSNTQDAEYLAYELNVFHLPVQENNRFLGLLPFDILSQEDIASKIELSHYKDDLLKIFAIDGDFVFDVLPKFTEAQISALPIIDEKGFLLGLLRESDVVKYLSQLTSTNNPGAFLTLRLGTNDYNLQEISRIVESNNARILSLQFEPMTEDEHLLCTIKINTKELKHILATFDRFNYEYIAHSSENEVDNQLQNRYDLLMKYLNI